MNERTVPRRSTVAGALVLGGIASVVAGALTMASSSLAAATLAREFGDWRSRAMVAANGSPMTGLVCLVGVVMWLVAAWLDGKPPARLVGILVVGVAAVGLLAAAAAVLAIVTHPSDAQTFGSGEYADITVSFPWEERVSEVLRQGVAIVLLAPVLRLAWPFARTVA